MAQALHGPALDLALGALAIDGLAHVIAGRELRHAGLPRLLVHLDLDGLGAEGVIVEGLALPGGGIDGRRRGRIVLVEGLDGSPGRRGRLHEGGEIDGAIRRAPDEGPPLHELDILGGGLQHLRGLIHQMPAHLARGLEDRVARHEELARGRRGAGARREVAVAPHRGHLLHGHAENLRGDRAERGGLSPAHVGGGAADDRGAIELHAHPGGGGVPRPAHAAIRREGCGESPRYAHRPAAGADRAQRLPGTAHGLPQHGLALEHLPRGDAVALPQEVPLAEVERIHGQRGGQSVHLSLVADARLDGAEGAVGARHGIVRVDGERVHGDVRDAVRSRRRHETVQEHPGREGGIRSRVRHELHLHGHQLTRPGGAGPVAQDIRMTLAVADEALFPGEHQLHGPARLPHEQAEEALDGHVLLAAEAAAQIGALEPHAPMGQPQHLGHVAEMLEHLGADAEDQGALGVDPADARLRLEVHVIHERGPVGLLHHDVRAREGLRGIALADMPGAEKVAALVDMGRAGPERLRRIVDARQRLVLHAHALRSLRGDLRSLRGDGRHGLALEAHPILGEHGLGREHGARRRLGHAPGQFHSERVLRHVGVGEHGDHSRQRAGLARVDPDDARRGIRAADDPGVEHAGHREVAGIDGTAPHFLPGVRPGLGPPDHAIGHLNSLSPRGERARVRGVHSAAPRHSISRRRENWPPHLLGPHGRAPSPTRPPSADSCRSRDSRDHSSARLPHRTYPLTLVPLTLPSPPSGEREPIRRPSRRPP